MAGTNFAGLYGEAEVVRVYHKERQKGSWVGVAAEPLVVQGGRVFAAADGNHSGGREASLRGVWRDRQPGPPSAVD